MPSMLIRKAMPPVENAAVAQTRLPRTFRANVVQSAI